MPEFVNISVGSLPGTSGLDATTVCPLEAKKSRKVVRISATVMAEWFMKMQAQELAAPGFAPRGGRAVREDLETHKKSPDFTSSPQRAGATGTGAAMLSPQQIQPCQKLRYCDAR